jgi:hypothetical protein
MNKMIVNQEYKIKVLRKEVHKAIGFRKNDLGKQLKEEIRQLKIAKQYLGVN